MQMNHAHFANKVVHHLAMRGMDATIEHADVCRIGVKDKAYEPHDDESPSRMAGRIWLAHISGAERLRAVVAWMEYHNENFNDRFTAEQIAKLWEYGQLNDDAVAEFADTWSEEQIAAALGDSWNVPPTRAGRPASPPPGRAQQPRSANLGFPPRWSAKRPTDRSPPRIVDVIIGGRFRPTRATWQKLIDAGLPMCSWQEASESWDMEASTRDMARAIDSIGNGETLMVHDH